MVKPLPVAHLHDFGLEVAQGSVGTAVLATGFCIGWLVHVGQERHFLNPQAVNDDMHMNVTAVVKMCIRDRESSKENFFASKTRKADRCLCLSAFRVERRILCVV